jgi:tetratricopeptide (TPR) repeat protein
MFKQWFHRVSRQVARYNAMLQGFERANSQAIDPAMAYVQWGVEQADNGDITGSIDKFRQAVSLSPNRPEGYTNWGVALAKMGQLEDAIEKFEQAIERAPHHATNYMLLGAALLEKGDVTAAADQYSKATDLDPNNPSPLINHGVALARIGQHAEAMVQFKKALALQKHQPHVYFLWGAALAELGQHPEAIEKFRLTVRYIPKHIEALSFWAVSLNELGQYQDALSKAQEVLTLDPDKPDVYLTIGDALANLGQLEPALQAYEQALQLDASQIDSLISLGMVHAQLGHWEQAEAAFEQAHLQDPDDPHVHRAWGLFLAQAAQTNPDRYRDALDKLKPYCDAHPDDLTTRIQLAVALVQTAQWPEAQQEIEHLLQQRPYDADTLALKAQLAQHQGQHAEAARLLQKAYNATPTAERAVQLCQIQLAQGQTLDAVRLIRPWYRQHPDSLPITLTYALALRDDGHTREAVDKLTDLLAQHPNHAGVLAALAETYILQDQITLATPLVQTLLTRHADLSMTRWLQCWLLVRQGGDMVKNQACEALLGLLTPQHSLWVPACALAAYVDSQTLTPEDALARYDARFNPSVPDMQAAVSIYRQQLQAYWAKQPQPVVQRPYYPLFL